MAELGWDDFIEEDGEGFTLLEPGDYDFTVTDFEKSTSKAGSKMAVLTMDVGDPIDSKVQIVDYIVLKDTMEWKISQFLRSVGLKKKGEKVPLKVFDKVLGKRGRCKVIQESFTGDDGKERKSNKIKRYYDPVSATSEQDEFSW